MPPHMPTHDKPGTRIISQAVYADARQSLNACRPRFVQARVLLTAHTMSAICIGMSMAWLSSAGIHTTHHVVDPIWPTSCVAREAQAARWKQHVDGRASSNTR